MVIFYRSTLDERLFYLDQQMWNPLYKAIALKTAKWNDVYMRNPNEDGPQEKLITFDKNIGVIRLPDDINITHVEQDQQYPGGGDFPVNPFTFFIIGKEPYWKLNENYAIYTYTTKRPLKLLYVHELTTLHDMLQKKLKPETFEQLPYNRDDPSFPYEALGKTYAWDYLDMGLICEVFGMDGMIRQDEICICAPYGDKLNFVQKQLMLPTTQYEGESIYYTPNESLVQKIRKELSLEQLLN